MGLDCHWVKPGEGKSAPLDLDLPLWGVDEDMHAEGWAYFPARAFEDAIFEVTRVSLRGPDHNDECTYVMDNATIRRMADVLTKFAAEPWPLPHSARSRGWHTLSREQWRDLARVFRAYGEGGYELFNNW